MPTEPYKYELIAQHPKLLAIYSGWLGQKICYLTHSAVTWDRSDLWSAAAAEVDRLVLVLCAAEKAKVFNLSGETGTALGKLVGNFAAGEWWTSKDGTRERAACQRNRHEQDEFSGNEPDPDDAPFQPHLLIERDSVYSVAPTVINQLDGVLMQTAVAMEALDLCRLGASLGGFCYRSTPQLHVRFVNSLLTDLAARGITDLESENAFRRTISLSEVSKDRRPRSLSDPAPLPPLVVEDVTSGGGNSSFDPYVGDMAEQRDLILAFVFQRFDVIVPPAECDASQYPELPRLKKKLRTASLTITTYADKTSLAGQTTFWAEEAIEYLGIARRNLARPDMALQRLIQKGALRPTKIGGRLVFKKAELDRVLEKGDQAPRRGRPRKDGK